MPIRPENKKLYPSDWSEISRSIREDRAGNRCECTGQCGSDHGGRCDAPNHTQIWRNPAAPEQWCTIQSFGWHEELRGPIVVVLTTMHLDHDPTNNDPANLLSACQRCHNRYDAPHRAETRRRTRDAETGQLSLFPLGGADG